MRGLFILLAICTLLTPVFGQKEDIQEPVRNFETLWATFDMRYANFTLKEVDWQEVYERYRPLVNEQTNNGALFELSCTMLQELNDGHVTITPDFSEGDEECGPPYEFQLDEAFSTEAEWESFQVAIAATFSKNGFGSEQRCKITEETNFHYRVADRLGYLRLDEMTEAITFGRFRRALQQSLAAFEGRKGLILDLRFNGGGWDRIAYQLASRFVPEGGEIGHYERTRIKGQDAFTPMKYRRVRSKGKTPFTQPVVILTSDFTASAAEVFLLVMQELPHVTIIGDHSEGIFSDMYEFRLPNKWEVSLSHQQYFSMDHINYEGQGIPPDIQILNSNSDIVSQHDPVLERAIQFLVKGIEHENVP